ncbi:hypothetical protein J6590_107223 [Homalodisca vitripennis]|nr:hypothetical protein J6590_107223 [Homalodisca vitripennis]
MCVVCGLLVSVLSLSPFTNRGDEPTTTWSPTTKNQIPRTQPIRTALEHEASVTLHRGLNAVRPPRPRNLLFDRTINTLTTRLDSGQYSVREFLEAASH